ncbi:monooxygenase [Xinfangfangia sp. D13-10-4-6]|uniref:acyl-CoA dehydrogenase family protein n=1 Tax=Pseudogemmobacter hezensis TaxID=2737662 RepID=UPI001556D59A|nr:acyl-CoA dehydrogenase family protein [Pseudogemmobacter hezensis]NPD16764.1 monooxygenase [Pseudogemmobacter hezensis]
MTQPEIAWGEGPGPGYPALAARFRPVFERIREGAIGREAGRLLPAEPIRWLKEAGFTRARLPVAEGGFGASTSDLFALLIELSAADSNVTQALRAHLGLVEDIVGLPDGPRRQTWAARIAAGETIGSAWSETGTAPIEGFATRLTASGQGYRLDGRKFYTTGSLFADWIDVGATFETADGPTAVAVSVRREAPGVEVIDDWDGFGQTGTASGTAIFTGVALAADDFVIEEGRFGYAPAFYQLVHLATLAGIGRAISQELAALVHARTRIYSNGAGPQSRLDPQVLQVVGKVRGAAYAASAIVLQVARALDRAFAARLSGQPAAPAPGSATLSAVEIAELETSQALPVVSSLILDAATVLFDALGASSTRKSLQLDRHWRNARTLASHNPRIYKDRIVGDYAVNGTPPPDQWRIGTPA